MVARKITSNQLAVFFRMYLNIGWVPFAETTVESCVFESLGTYVREM